MPQTIDFLRCVVPYHTPAANDNMFYDVSETGRAVGGRSRAGQAYIGGQTLPSVPVSWCRQKATVRHSRSNGRTAFIQCASRFAQDMVAIEMADRKIRPHEVLTSKAKNSAIAAVTLRGQHDVLKVNAGLFILKALY